MIAMKYKKCRKCGIKKPATLEYFTKEKGCTDELRSRCKECRKKYRNNPKIKEKAKIRMHEWHIENREKVAERSLLKKYGITLKEKKSMIKNQNNKCKICGIILTEDSRKSNSAHVDHHHLTNEIRGILCARCNHGLGSFIDNPLILTKAIKYLRGEI